MSVWCVCVCYANFKTRNCRKEEHSQNEMVRYSDVIVHLSSRISQEVLLNPHSLKLSSYGAPNKADFLVECSVTRESSRK